MMTFKARISDFSENYWCFLRCWRVSILVHHLKLFWFVNQKSFFTHSKHKFEVFMEEKKNLFLYYTGLSSFYFYRHCIRCCCWNYGLYPSYKKTAFPRKICFPRCRRGNKCLFLFFTTCAAFSISLNNLLK